MLSDLVTWDGGMIVNQHLRMQWMGGEDRVFVGLEDISSL